MLPLIPRGALLSMPDNRLYGIESDRVSAPLTQDAWTTWRHKNKRVSELGGSWSERAHILQRVVAVIL